MGKKLGSVILVLLCLCGCFSIGLNCNRDNHDAKTNIEKTTALSVKSEAYEVNVNSYELSGTEAFTTDALNKEALNTETLNTESIATQSNLDIILNGHIVAIDPGHQAKGNFGKEPIGPGSTTMKTKVAGGTYGRTTGVPEYQLTLTVSLLLKEELIKRGYEVVMTRETNDVDITNSERAIIANESGAEVFVRIHADGSDSASAKGMMTICPTSKNPYCPQIYQASRRLSDLLLTNMFASTSTSKGYVWETDTMSGINWCTIPVSIIEMGFMTNPEEDVLMETTEYQLKLVDGIANGIDAYFLETEQEK